MSYEVGTHINLQTGRVTEPEAFKEARQPSYLYAVGTQFINRLVNGQPRLVMKIPIMAA